MSDGYTQEQIAEMIDDLAEAEWENLDDKCLRAVLREGCVGWNNMSREEIIEYHNDKFGDEQ